MNLRLCTVALLLGGTALILRARGNADFIPKSEPLADVPEAIGGWQGTDTPIDEEALHVLGEGEFLSRVYSRVGQAKPIGLFIGYFPTQRTGSTMHSPKNCLPGSGWIFESSQYVNLSDTTGKQHRVGEYLVANGSDRSFVIYWYQAHGRSIANEYRAKIYMVADALRMNRTDGALVRVITPLDSGESMRTAQARAERFTEQLMPSLPRFIPD